MPDPDGRGAKSTVAQTDRNKRTYPNQAKDSFIKA